MATLDARLESLGVRRPAILLPSSGIDLYKWAVIACDQHTSNPEYWREVETLVGDEPSTLHLVFPEVYLGAGDETARITEIKDGMRRYLEEGTLREEEPSFVLVQRRTDGGLERNGILLAVDLEAYDFAPEATTLIRATEGTILERLPPRIRIREGAPLELPHVMLLIDDPEDRVIGPVAAVSESLRTLYDTDLMMGGGHVRGSAVDEPHLLEHLTARFEEVASRENSLARYGVETSLLFAVGDGNHSLATAKRVWENAKAAGADPASHPARYALVELVNIHSVPFEPIHRVVFGSTIDQVRDALAAIMEDNHTVPSADEAVRATKDEERAVALIHPDGAERFRCSGSGLVHAEVQRALEAKLAGGTQIDYVHGEREAQRIVGNEGAVAVVLPPFDRSALFRDVVNNGPLPRKVFSMGHAEDKRYYMEARRIDA